MPDDTNVEQLLENVQKALKALESIDNLENVINKLDGDNNRKLFKKVKHTLNECYSKIGNIRDKVSKAYKKGKVKGTSDSNDLDGSIIENNSTDRNEEKEVESILENNSNNCEESHIEPDNSNTKDSGLDCTQTENQENGSEDKASPSRVKSSEEKNENRSLIQDSTDSKELIEGTPVKSNNINGDKEEISESDEKSRSDELEESEKVNQAESIEKTTNPLEIETDVACKDNIEATNGKSDAICEEPIRKFPLIKLVDINKLMETKKDVVDLLSPKPRKSVTFDSSVIILSSSDEETPKKNPKERKNPLKSAMRKSPNIDITSDSDSKETKEKSKKTKDNSKKKLRKKILSSDESDNSSDDQKSNNRKLRHNRQRKRPTSRLRSRQRKEDNSSEESSAEANIIDSESDSEPIRKPRKRKKDDLSSEDSGDEFNSKKKSKGNNVLELSRDDKKLKSEVTIRLPSYTCEELVNMRQNKEKLPEIKKSRPKRIKLTLKLNKKLVSSCSNSDEESVGKDNGNKKPDEEKEASEEMEAASEHSRDLGPEKEEENGPVKEPPEEEKSEANKEEVLSKEPESPKLNGKLSDGEEENEKNPVKESKQVTQNSMKDSSDDDDFGKFSKKKVKENEIKASDDEIQAPKRKNKKKSKKNAVLSDSESDNEQNNEKKDDSSDSNKSEPEDKPVEKKKKRKAKKNTVLTDSDSNNEQKNEKDNDSSDSNKSEADEKRVEKKNKRKAKKNAVLTDSDSNNEQKNQKEDDSSDSSNSEADEKPAEKKPARRRIKSAKDSSSDDEDKSTRKHIRKVIGRDSLSETTKKAEQDEKERKTRMAEKQKKYNQIFQMKADVVPEKVVLDFDEKDETPLLSVHKRLVKQLKPHQVQGVKFMWDACFESIKRAKTTAGSGCILAHCMGLGKTLQVITLSHTLLTNSDETNVEKVMVVCPVNTVLNWKNEFAKWIPKDDDFEVYELVSCKTSSVNLERSCKVREWHENGGVLIIGYNMFRTLTNPDNKTVSKKIRGIFHQGLVDPGPDLVVCDEGHLLKNEKTSLSIAMNKIKTLRRIVLTGTPLQNNLREYWCMVQFIKPNLLGTYKEYLNRFVNPITNGQYTDSTPHDIAIMRRRSHVLHKLLDGVVQRQDYAVLAPYLPPKYEFILFIKLTNTQVKLYKHYIEHLARRGDTSSRTSVLFADFQQLQRIGTHPRVLKEKSIEDKEKQMMESDSEGSLRDFIDDGSDEAGTSTPDSDSSESNSASDISIRSDSNKKKKKKKSPAKRKRCTRAQAAQKREAGEESDSEVEAVEPKEWWQEYIDSDELDNPDHSAKMFLLFEILRECEEIGDKILVFSQSLYTLNCIEYFLEKIDEATQRGESSKNGGHVGSWAIGLDYFRLDGSSSCDNRAIWCDAFNNPNNIRARLFLISTKAGGLGINLVAANRVIIFDVSWNPSHDIQSIYRVYRFGQTKPCYIYRFVNYGTMEMKIYERQVTKQAISKRVIDEQQIDRHYSQNDIQELYKIDLEPADRPIPLVPKDVLLGEMLQKYEGTIFKYHEHQSLLENKQDEELNEEERKAAWEEFENEKELRRNVVTNYGGMGNFNMTGPLSINNFSPQLIQLALGNIVRKDNPTWSDLQIKGILPALVQQLQMQISENNFSLFNRVQQEVRLMQALQAQRMREQYIQEMRMRQMLQKQQMSNQLLGNMTLSPEEIRLMQMAAAHGGGPGSMANRAGSSRDIIELND